MPPIPPTLRQKERYILFEVASEAPVGEAEVKNAAYNSILSFLGEYGSSLASPKFISYDPAKRLAILRCSHTELQKVKAALALCSSVGGKRAAFRIKKVSGTIAGLSR